MRIEPYLFFEGRCDEAIAFYKGSLGGTVNMIMRYKDCPQGPPGGFPAEMLDKVMHASVSIGATTLLLSDGHCKTPANFSGFSLSLAVASDAEAKQRFDSLADGGKICMPLGKAFFASSFGMVVDRFGVSWMVMVEH